LDSFLFSDPYFEPYLLPVIFIQLENLIDILSKHLSDLKCQYRGRNVFTRLYSIDGLSAYVRLFSQLLLG